MISEPHWQAVAIDSEPKNKLPLGLLEQLGDRMSVIQRHPCGLNHEGSLELEMLTCT